MPTARGKRASKHQVKDFSKTRRGQYLQHREGAPVGGGTPAATSANKPHLEKVLFKTRKGLHFQFVPDPNLDQWINSEVKHDKLTGKHVKHTGEILNKAERDTYTQYRHRHVARCRLGDERTVSLIGGTTPLTPRRTQSPQTQPLVPKGGMPRLRGPGATKPIGGKALASLVNGRANTQRRRGNPQRRRGDRVKPGGANNPYNVRFSKYKHTWQDGEQNRDYHQQAQSEPIVGGHFVRKLLFLQECTVLAALVQHLPFAAQRGRQD